MVATSFFSRGVEEYMISEGSTKEALLKATLEITAVKGGNGTSIREIAARAGVNSAAISYYFGSKDQLIKEASKYYYKLVEEVFQRLFEGGKNPIERVRNFAITFMVHINHYPGFLKSEIAQHLVSAELSSEAGTRMKLQVEAVAKVLSEILSTQNQEIVTIKAIQFLSCLVYPQLWGKSSFEVICKEKNYDQFMEVYVDELIKSICTSTALNDKSVVLKKLIETKDKDI